MPKLFSAGETQLENNFNFDGKGINIKKQDIQIICTFENSEVRSDFAKNWMKL